MARKLLSDFLTGTEFVKLRGRVQDIVNETELHDDEIYKHIDYDISNAEHHLQNDIAHIERAKKDIKFLKDMKQKIKKIQEENNE